MKAGRYVGACFLGAVAAVNLYSSVDSFLEHRTNIDAVVQREFAEAEELTTETITNINKLAKDTVGSEDFVAGYILAATAGAMTGAAGYVACGKD